MSRGNFSPLRPDLKHLRRLEIVNYWHDNGEYVWQEIENRKWKKTESEGGGRGLRVERRGKRTEGRGREREPDTIRRNERSPDLVRE